MPLGEQVASQLSPSFVYIFPAAPHALPQGGRAWYQLDIQSLIFRAMHGQMDSIMNENPPGLAESRAKMQQLLKDVCKEYQVDHKSIILGGLSQVLFCQFASQLVP